MLQVVFFPMPGGAVLSGIILGLLGALGAIGLALIWRANRVINFAQGDLGVFPATLTVLLITLAGVPWLLGLTAGLAAAVLTGLLADILVIRRFFKAPRLIMTVATIGLSQVLAFCSLLLPELWDEGPAIRSLPVPFAFTFEFGGVIFDANDLIALIVAPALLVAVSLLLRVTDTGTAVRAAADRSDRAALLGIPVRRLEAQVWTLATVLSFCSVVLTAGVASLPFGFGLGLFVVLRALAALVIGRMTHLVSIATTAIAIGVLEAGIRWNTGDSWLVSPILAALIIASLLLQRRGETRADRDDVSSWQSSGDVRAVPPALARLPEVRLAYAAGWILLAVLSIGLPLLLGTNGQLKAGVVLIFAMVGTSVVVLTGWAGQVSLGQMAFVGAGGAVGAWVMVDRGLDPVVAMLAAGAGRGRRRCVGRAPCAATPWHVPGRHDAGAVPCRVRLDLLEPHGVLDPRGSVPQTGPARADQPGQSAPPLLLRTRHARAVHRAARVASARAGSVVCSSPFVTTRSASPPTASVPPGPS